MTLYIYSDYQHPYIPLFPYQNPFQLSDQSKKNYRISLNQPFGQNAWRVNKACRTICTNPVLIVACMHLEMEGKYYLSGAWVMALQTGYQKRAPVQGILTQKKREDREQVSHTQQATQWGEYQATKNSMSSVGHYGRVAEAEFRTCLKAFLA